MASTSGTLARIKQPEYTGENRCMPCTVVNTIIAVVLCGLLAAGVLLAASPAVGAVAGGASFVGCLAAIYLRGYLVPGTPELTKRHFPPWLLALFGKEPERPGEDLETEIDPEAELLKVDALEPCQQGEDLCLTESFRGEWYEEVDRVKAGADANRERLLDLLGLDEADVSFTEHGAAFQAFVDGTVVGRWESEAAFLADLGAARTLEARYADWDRLPVEARGQLLNGLRLFIDTCPGCGGTPTFDTDTVESCCSTREVAAVTCDECDSRLFESAI